jgi:hypothetical protein
MTRTTLKTFPIEITGIAQIDETGWFRDQSNVFCGHVFQKDRFDCRCLIRSGTAHEQEIQRIGGTSVTVASLFQCRTPIQR